MKKVKLINKNIKKNIFVSCLKIDDIPLHISVLQQNMLSTLTSCWGKTELIAFCTALFEQTVETKHPE